jgi:hypothetical protein
MAWLNLKNIYKLEKFDNYEMNQEGVLRNVKTKRILKGALTKGYVKFDLYQDGFRKMVYKHRILAELFVWNPDDLPCVDHIDRNRLNNSIENLRWCSYEENNRNMSMRKDNTSGKMNIHKCFNHGQPRWLVRFGNHSTGNHHQKRFPRNQDSDIIPDEVIAYRDAYSKQWKGPFHPE